MDFHSMKRKQLQALCKKHGIPANLSNLDMSNRISEALKGKEDSVIQRPIEGQDEKLGGIESADVTVNKKVKKVTFSPEHELIEFSRSKLKGRSTTNMVVSKSSNSSVVNVSSNDTNKEDLGRRGRALRSRGLKSMEGNVNEKRGKSPEKGKGKNINASAVEILDNGKSKEGDAESSSKEILLRGKNRPTKRAKGDGKCDNKALDSVDNEKLIEKVVDNPGRVTRSRVQKLTEVSAKEENRGRKVAKRAGYAADETDCARDRGERDKSKGKSMEEDLENKIVEEHDVIEPQIVRRSKRNTNRVAASEILYVDKRKNDSGEGNNGLRKKSKLMTTNVSGVAGEGNGSEVNNSGGESSKVEEPIKVEPRRSNRRKNVMEADELVAKTENGHPSRCSVPQLGTAEESSKDEKKVVQPTGAMRRSRRKTLSAKLVSEDIKTDTHLVVENLEADTENRGVLGNAGEASKDEKKVILPTGVLGRSRRKTLSAKLVSEDIKTDTHLVVENLEADTENRGVLGNAGEASKDEKKVIQPTGVLGRSRRKTLSVKLVSVDETENKCVLRGSVPELEIAGEVSKDEKKVLQPTGVTRSSRCKTLSVKTVSADEKVHTHLALEKLETETEVIPVSRGSVLELGIAGEVSKDEKKVLLPVNEANDTILAMEKLEEEELKPETRPIEKDCSAVQQSTRRSRRIASKCQSPGEIDGESVIHQKDKVIKRKSDDMKTNNKETSRKKSVLEPSSGKVADSGKRKCRLDDFKVFDASSHNDLEVGEHFVAKAQPCESEGLGSTCNFGVSANTSAEDTHKKTPEASIAENAGNSDMELINGTELVENAAPRNTEFKTDVEDDQISVRSIRGVEKDHLLSQIDVHELLDQNVTNMDKNEPEAYLLSETEDLGCNSKMDNQVLPECSNVSGSEGFNESGSSTDSLLCGDQTDTKTFMEVTETEVDRRLQTSPSVVSRAAETEGISVEENLGSDVLCKDNQVLPECSKISEQEYLAKPTSSADNPLLGDQTDIKTDVEVSEVEAEECLQANPCVSELKVIAAHENQESDEPGQDDQLLPEVSNDSGKEGSAETGSSADNALPAVVEMAEGEAEKSSQSNPCVVGQHKVIAAQENLDYDETGIVDQLFPEFSQDSGKEAEAGSCADISLLGGRIDIMTDLDAARAEADKYSQPSPNVVAHVSAVKGLYVQENLDLDESRKDNQEGLNVSGSEGFAGLLLDDQTDTTVPEVANAEGDNCLQRSPNEVDHEVKIVSVQENFDFGETKQTHMSSPVSCHHIDVGHLKKSDNILDNNIEETQADAGAAMSCAEKPIDCNQSRSIMNSKNVDMRQGNEAFFHKVSLELTRTDEDGSFDIHQREFCIPEFSGDERSTEIVPQDNLKKGHEVYLRENCTDKSSNSEDGITVEDEFQHESKCDEHGEFSVSDLFEVEARPGIVAQEKEREAFSDEYSLKDFDEPEMFQGLPSLGPTSICNSTRDHELDLIFEGYEASICKDKQSERVDADESYEDRKFTISNLLDGERSARIKDSNKQDAKSDVPAISTTCENFNEVEFNGSKLQEISASKPVGISESQEQPKSPLAETFIVANIQMPDDDADDAECGNEKYNFSISKIEVEGLTDMKLQDIEETEEEQTMNTLEKQSKTAIGEDFTEMKTIQSWTEIELHNLFGTLDKDTPGRNITSSCQTETANLTCTSESISKIRNSLTKQEIEMEEERSECEKIENEIVLLPTSDSEVSDSGLNVEAAENQLATPVNKDETGSHGRELDRTVVSVIKCSDTMKENVETQSKSDENDTLSDNDEGVTCEGLNEVESAEVVNISATGLPKEQLTENTGECLKETIQTNVKVEDKEEKVIPLREACLYEAPGNDSRLTEGYCISPSDSPRNLVQLEGSQGILTDTVLSQSITCESRIYHKTEGDMTQSSEAAFELSDADQQRSNLPEKSNHLIACFEDGNILSETAVESFRGPLDADVAETSIFDGNSPCLFSKFMEYDEGDSVRTDNDQCGTNIWNEKDGNSRSSQDISDDNLEGDHEKTEKEKEENLTDSTAQFSIPQLHFEEQAEDFNIQIHNISDLPPSECTETLKESDVADTIKEYIDSESSLSMISENSSVSFPIDETTHADEKMGHENGALSRNNEDVAERFTNTEDDVDKQSVGFLQTESNELEAAAASFIEPAPACVDFLVDGSTGPKPLVESKGFDVKLDSQKQIEAEDGQNSCFKQLCSTAKKNARTILIHGTPGKGPDMKENAPMGKKSNVGDLTTVRPAKQKRKALQDVR